MLSRGNGLPERTRVDPFCNIIWNDDVEKEIKDEIKWLSRNP